MKKKSRPKRYRLRSLCGIGRYTLLVRVKEKKKPEPRRTQGGFPKGIIANIWWELKHSGW